MKLAFVLLAAVIAASPAAAQTATPGPGIPLDVATRRFALISDLHYELALNIPDAVNTPIVGAITARFQLAEASQPLVMDFATRAEAVQGVESNGVPVTHTYVNGHIVIPAAGLKVGPNAVRVAFTAGDASLNRHPDFLYTLFVPARAHLAIPCFDQPDLKGRWSVTLEHPAAWQSAANGVEL